MSRVLVIGLFIVIVLIGDGDTRHQRPPGPQQPPQQQGQRPPQHGDPRGQPPPGQQPPQGQRAPPHQQRPGQPQAQQGQPLPGPPRGQQPPNQFPSRDQRPPQGRPGPPVMQGQQLDQPPPPEQNVAPVNQFVMDNSVIIEPHPEKIPAAIDFYGGGLPPDPKDELIPISGPRLPGSNSLTMTEDEMEEKVGDLVYEMLEVISQEEHSHHNGTESIQMYSMFFCIITSIFHIVRSLQCSV